MFNLGASLGRVGYLGPPLGFAVGALISAFGIGGPLLVLYLLNREWPPQVVRASLAFYFLIIMSAGVVGYGVAGLYTPQRLALILIVLTPVLVGFRLARRLLGRSSKRFFRRGAIGVILLASIMVLAREVWVSEFASY